MVLFSRNSHIQSGENLNTLEIISNKHDFVFVILGKKTTCPNTLTIYVPKQ